MKKIVFTMALATQFLSLAAFADLSNIKCDVELVKKDGTSISLTSNQVKVNASTHAGTFDTFKAGADGLDSNTYRVNVSLRPNLDDQTFSTNIEFVDRIGGANSSFFTTSNGTIIIASLDSSKTYKLLGDPTNFRILLTCK